MVMTLKNFPVSQCKQGVTEKDQNRGKHSSAFSNQIILALTELWYRESCQSSLYLAHTLDELGVEKYLPGAAEVFSGTLSLLRTSLPPCSKNPCTPTAVFIEHITNVTTTLLALEQSKRKFLCNALIQCSWRTPHSSQISRRIRLLAKAFGYANLRISLDEPQWRLLENFQRRYYRVSSIIH